MREYNGYEEKMEYAISYNLLCTGNLFYDLHRGLGDADSANPSIVGSVFNEDIDTYDIDRKYH